MTLSNSPQAWTLEMGTARPGIPVHDHLPLHRGPVPDHGADVGVCGHAPPPPSGGSPLISVTTSAELPGCADGRARRPPRSC